MLRSQVEPLDLLDDLFDDVKLLFKEGAFDKI